jgi:hypothetical protein
MLYSKKNLLQIIKRKVIEPDMNDLKIKDRRKGPDVLLKTISIITGITWFFILLFYIIISYARPQIETRFFNSLFKVPIENNWDKSLLPVAIIILALLVIICFIGIVVNFFRHKRRTDRFNKSLIFFGLGSLMGLIYFFQLL